MRLTNDGQIGNADGRKASEVRPRMLIGLALIAIPLMLRAQAPIPAPSDVSGPPADATKTTSGLAYGMLVYDVELLDIKFVPVDRTVQVVAPNQNPPLERPEIYVLVGDKPAGITVEVELGQTRSFTIADGSTFHVGSYEPFQLQNPPTVLRWSIQPPDGGVEITASGRVNVRPNARPGMYTIRAEIPGKTLTREIQVFDPRRMPLVGAWREAAQIACDDGREFVPPLRIGELIFEAGGHFTATWRPFETRIDMSGTYDYSPGRNLMLTVPVRPGNAPPEMTPQGTATIDSTGRLILKGIWLGFPPNYPSSPGAGAATEPVRACGHVFSRQK